MRDDALFLNLRVFLLLILVLTLGVSNASEAWGDSIPYAVRVNVTPSSHVVPVGGYADFSIDMFVYDDLQGCGVVVRTDTEYLFSLDVKDLPPGVNYEFTPNSLKFGVFQISNSSTLRIGPLNDNGSLAFTVEARETQINKTYESKKVTLNIGQPPPDFELNIQPSNFTITAGRDAVLNVTITPYSGFDSPVNLNLQNAPAGITAKFQPETILLNESAIMQIQTIPGLQPGQYPLNVTGTSNGVMHVNELAILVYGTTENSNPYASYCYLILILIPISLAAVFYIVKRHKTQSKMEK
jgi:hypothetical protein